MRRLLVSLIAIALLPTLPAFGQEDPWLSLTPIQEDADAIRLYEGVAPGSENAAQTETWFTTPTERWVTNITVPTLLPVLPEDPAQTRAAVIIVPGGGFQFVSIDNEGYPIAEWLADQGIAAFILKYRVMQTPEDPGAFSSYIDALFSSDLDEAPVDIEQGIPHAVADARAALALVRSRAEDWGYDADKVGLLGFSAGAITALGLTLSTPEPTEAPDFIGLIYGPMTAVEPPESPPPLFAALTSDDGFFAGQGFGLIDAWQAGGGSVELHYYERGGHGFGSYKRGVTADLWFDQYLAWMRTRGLLAPASD